jgi:hypothetical protein
MDFGAFTMVPAVFVFNFVMANHPEGDLATVGYRPAMKVEI